MSVAYCESPRRAADIAAHLTLEELAYPMCIERAPALLDTQFFEYLKVPRWYTAPLEE